MFSFLAGHPRLTAAACAVVLFFAVTAIPVTYQRTVGHEIAMTLSGPQASEAVADQVAKNLESTLETGSIQLGVTNSNGQNVYHLATEVPLEQGDLADAVVKAISRRLTDRGIATEGTVTPKKERTSGNLYAAVHNQVVEINLDGKTPEAIEQEILDALMDSGVTSADVSVTKEGDRMRMEVTMEVEGEPGTVVEPTLMFTRDGQTLGGQGTPTQMMCCEQTVETNAAGLEVLTLEITKDGKTLAASVTDPKSLSDEAIRTELERQLKAHGVDLGVTVKGGQVCLADPSQGLNATPGRVEETTWGAVKKQNLEDDSN